MKGRAGWDRRRTVALILVCVLAAIALGLGIHALMKVQKIRGLLVDLELQGPDATRYGELRDALVAKLPGTTPALRKVDVSLDYVHFSRLDGKLSESDKFDFVLLSPQATPWYMYRGEATVHLDRLKGFVRDLVFNGNKPLLGICGGHQFLALTFGAPVDFIDGRFSGRFPAQYPKEAISERGPVLLETIRDDEILAGIASHPGRLLVFQSHYEEVKRVPEPFVNIARSGLSEVQLIRFPGRPVYGMAFHPERGWDSSSIDANATNAGQRILANFLAMVVESKRSGPGLR